MTTEEPEGEPLRYGLVIEWPGPPATGPARISPQLVSVFETDALGAERQLPGVTRLTLRLLPGEQVSADVETILGEDGEPLRFRGRPAVTGDGLATAAFRYEVTAMKIRDAVPPAGPSPALLGLAARVNDAGMLFRDLGDDELTSLPPKARAGIAAVFGAIADYTSGSAHRDLQAAQLAVVPRDLAMKARLPCGLPRDAERRSDLPVAVARVEQRVRLGVDRGVQVAAHLGEPR